MAVFLDNRTVLITGGTGTVGEALLENLLKYDIKHIYIFSRDEYKQDILSNKLNHPDNVSFIIGDIRNYNSLNSIMKGVDIVFHTAAMKIVRICEYNPYEALNTNIIGAENLIRSAIANNVEKVIFTSSDKAASPTSLMGISKLFCERMISHANFLPKSNTIFSSIRFGNIIGSRGSVLDLFINQIKNGEDVTVTDKDMSRFILSIDEAVNFLIKSAEISMGGEILVNKMPSLKICDLAKTLINYLAPKFGKDPDSIKIKIIGKQEVEKLYEELIAPSEISRSLEFQDYYCILPTIYKDKWKDYGFKNGKKLTGCISSDKVDKYMTEKDILAFLLDKKLI